MERRFAFTTEWAFSGKRKSGPSPGLMRVCRVQKELCKFGLFLKCVYSDRARHSFSLLSKDIQTGTT